MTGQTPEEENVPERFYIIGKGRSRPSEQVTIDLVTLIVSRSEAKVDTQPEHAAILRLCRNPLSVAEICAYLSLPTGMVTVLLADLIGTGRVEARQPVPIAIRPDIQLLEAVLNGLQKL